MLNNQIRELIPIEVHNGQQAVNARHLYAWLGIKKDFNNWMKRQINRCDLTENVDYQSFYQVVEREIGGTTRYDYALSLNAAKEISMMSQTEKGKEARRYFIECERIAQEKDRTTMTALPDFTNPAEAARAWALQYEKNEQLQLENKTLHEDIQTQQNINNLLQGEIDVMEPKARIYDSVIHTPDNTSLSTTTAVANEIGMSGKKLNAHLVACGIIYKSPSGDYLMASEYLRWNIGQAVSALVNEDKGIVRTYIKWNARGRAYIHALYETNWDKRRAWHLLRRGRVVNEEETAIVNHC